MGNNKLPKTELYTRIRANSAIAPDKPAIYNAAGSFISYKDVIGVYDGLKSFFENQSIKPYERLTIISKDEILASALALPVCDNAILIPIDFETSEEKFKYYFNLLDTDYILTDDLSSGLCRIASEMGMGIIHFISDTERKSVDFRLAAERKKKHTTEKMKKSEYIKISTTSGTTSTPKIVPRTAASFNSSLSKIIEHYHYTSDDNILILSRIFKGYAINTVFRSLSAGGSLVLAGGFNHTDLYNLVKIYRITSFTTVPAVLSSFAKYAENYNIDFSNSSLRFIQSAGAPLSIKLKDYLEGVFHVRIEQNYGMTEVAIISSTYNAHKGYKKGSVGTSPILDVKTVDGEILVRGATVFDGYENIEIDNNKYFTDGWFHTGDIGYIDNDGYIFITGRIKEMINRGGEKVSPYEVENAIMMLDTISDTAVFPYPDSYGSENVGAVVILSKDESIDIKELRKLLRGKLPSFKMPKILFITDEIPKSENGKVQRKLLYKQLKEKYPVQSFESREKKDLILTKTEKEVRYIWKKVLKIKNTPINDTFTELGGDSMDGAVVLSEIENRFNIRIPVGMLFENGTIKLISQFLDNEANENRQFKFLVPVKVSGSKKPLICVHSGTGDAVTYRHIGKYMDEDRPLYALRFDLKTNKWPQPLEFKHLSREYAEEIKRLDPQGPYNLCGHCWGGVLAFCIASELVNRGCRVSLLAMLDSAPMVLSENQSERETANHLSLKRVLGKSLRNLKRLPFKDKLKYILRKISNIGNLIKLRYSAGIYEYGIKNRNSICIKLAGKTGMLTYAYQKYRPKHYDGKLIYFKTTVDAGRSIKFPDYWKSMATEFKRVDMNCEHNDIVVGEGARALTVELEKIMGSENA